MLKVNDLQKLKWAFAFCSFFHVSLHVHAHPGHSLQDVLITIQEDLSQDVAIEVHEGRSSKNNSLIEPKPKWKQLMGTLRELQRKVQVEVFDAGKIKYGMYDVSQTLRCEFPEIKSGHRITHLTQEIISDLETGASDGFRLSSLGPLDAKFERLHSEMKKASFLSLLPRLRALNSDMRQAVVRKIGSTLSLSEISDLARIEGPKEHLWTEIRKDREEGIGITLVAIRESFLSTDYLTSSELSKMICVGNGCHQWKDVVERWQKDLRKRVISYRDVVQFPQNLPDVPVIALEGKARVGIDQERLAPEQEHDMILYQLESVCRRLGVRVLKFTVREQTENEIQGEVQEDGVYGFSDGALTSNLQIELTKKNLNIGQVSSSISFRRIHEAIAYLIAVQAGSLALMSTVGDMGALFELLLPGILYFYFEEGRGEVVRHLLFEDLLFFYEGPPRMGSKDQKEVDLSSHSH